MLVVFVEFLVPEGVCRMELIQNCTSQKSVVAWQDPASKDQPGLAAHSCTSDEDLSLPIPVSAFQASVYLRIRRIKWLCALNSAAIDKSEVQHG